MNAMSSYDEDHFLVTPFKSLVGVLIHSYLKDQSKLSLKEKACFARLVFRWIQFHEDVGLSQVKEILQKNNLNGIKESLEEKLQSITLNGHGQLIEIIGQLKDKKLLESIHRSSFLGLFIRRLDLALDRLSFTALDLLYDSFILFIREENTKTDHNPTTKKFENLSQREMAFLLSKQVKLLTLDEKKAMEPKELAQLLKSISRQNQQVRLKQELEVHQGNVKSSSLSNNTSQKSLTDFIRFLNCIRTKDLTGSQDALVSYFDSSNQTSCCWAVYNQARLRFLFNQDERCRDAILECLSFSQGISDDMCLEFCLLLLAKLLIRRRNRSSSLSCSHDLDEDLVALLLHLSCKGYTTDLPALSAISGLHLEQLVLPLGLKVSSVSVTPNIRLPHNQHMKQSQPTMNHIHSSEVTAVKYSVSQVLPMVYSNRASHFSLSGQPYLSNLSSQVLLHLRTGSLVGQDYVQFIDENYGIALANISKQVWESIGEGYDSLEVLKLLGRDLYSFYSDSNSFWKQRVAEIEFEKHLLGNNLKEANACLDTIALLDDKEFLIRKMQLLVKTS